MATPANLRHELANTLIEHDGTADETVLVLLERLATAEAEWAKDPLNRRLQGQSFLEWLAS
jgi:hypothetical protein